MAISFEGHFCAHKWALNDMVEIPSALPSVSCRLPSSLYGWFIGFCYCRLRDYFRT